MEEIYRKVAVRIWADERFRKLSPMPPCGQSLWLFLLTCPFTGPMPGIFRAGPAAMAEELGWTLEAFTQAFDEASAQGMVKADFKARLVWLPKAIEYNRPESPNVVRHWASQYSLLPECPLLDEAIASIRAYVCAMGEGFSKAFSDGFGEASTKAHTQDYPQGQPEALPEGFQKGFDKGLPEDYGESGAGAGAETGGGGERASAQEPPPESVPSQDNSGPGEPSSPDPEISTNAPTATSEGEAARAVVADWFQALSDEIKGRADPPPKAERWALAVVRAVNGDVSLAARMRAEYFAHWHDIWYAYTRGQRNTPAEKRTPDFDFRMYCTQTADLMARLAAAPKKAPPPVWDRPDAEDLRQPEDADLEEVRARMEGTSLPPGLVSALAARA